MDQAPDRAQQAPTETHQTPTGAQQAAPRAQQTPDAAEPRSITPLGELISEESLVRLVGDPLGWYLQYWLDLNIIGMMRGEDQTLLSIRIMMEQDECPEMLFKVQIRNAWQKYQTAYKELRIRQWLPLQGDLGDEAKPFHRDLDRLLVKTKGPKVRDYIRRFEISMNEKIRATEVDRAKHLFEWLVQINQSLKKEEAAEAEARNQPNEGDTQ